MQNLLNQSVKDQDQRGVIKELESLGNNVYSLAGIPVGNYILDVIVDLGSNKKGAYETILVILAQGQQPVPPQQIIQTVKISDDIGIIFPPDDNQTDPDPPPEESEPGYVLVGDNCELKPCDENTPPGQLCNDEGDTGTCEPGYVDKGKGSEPENEQNYVLLVAREMRISLRFLMQEIKGGG